MENNNNGIYWGLGIIAVLGGAGFVYYKYGMPETTVTTSVTDKEIEKPTGSSDKPQPQPAETKPVTPAPDVKKDTQSEVSSSSPQTIKGYNLRQKVTVKAGAVITRMDNNFKTQGTTKLSSNTNLGTIYHLNPNSAVVKASAGFSYPFYQVAYTEIKSDLITDATTKVKQVAGDLLKVDSWFADNGDEGSKISSDAFGEK